MHVVTRLLERALPWVFLVGAAVTAVFVLASPSLPEWGKRHTPHLQKPPLTFSSGHTAEQTFTFEAQTLDRIVLWLDTTGPVPRDGGLTLEVDARGERRTSQAAFADVPESGAVVFSIDPSLTAPPGTEAIFRLQLAQPGQTVGLRYQIDQSKYPEGTLVFGAAKGDLAFQLRYQRPALGSGMLQGLYALGILLAGAIAARLLRRRAGGTSGSGLSRRTWLFAGGLGLAVALFYGWFLLRPGFWVGPTDFSKDAAYLASAAEALRSGTWPVWSHRTCGGMALLGNPEGNTFSIGTLLATVLPPDKALLLLLVVEGGLSAMGTYLLARTLGLRSLGSIAAAIIASLSAGYAYRIVEGLTPVGGAVAFLPWVFFTLVLALKTRAGIWVVASGTALAAMFLRGDVHVVVAVGATAALWLGIAALRQRSLAPLGILVGMGAVAFLWGSIKILPYFEQPSLIQRDLPPYVVPLAQFGLLDDALLRIHDRGGVDVRPLHDRRLEQWGNFGGYVGATALVLGAIGILTRHRHRWPILAAALLALAIGEGALFETVLRHQAILGSLLRVPTRVLSVFAAFLGLLAGIGLDRIARDFRGTSRAVAGFLLLVLASELGYATGRILLANTAWNTAPATVFPSGPTLIPHAGVPPNDERHATKLTRTGFLLPKICGDQNNPPPFVKELKEPTPLATVPSETKPNRILLAAQGGPDDIIVRERFTSSWISTDADVLQHDDGALHVIVRERLPKNIELRYVSATARAQQILFLLLVGTLLVVLGTLLP